MKAAPQFEKEADLVVAFGRATDRWNAKAGGGDGIWTLYHETAGFDVLAAHSAGYQIGIEAKLSLNPDVLLQVVPDRYDGGFRGPDYRAVLVPRRCTGYRLGALASRLGVTVLTLRDSYWRPETFVYPADFDGWEIEPGFPREGEHEYLHGDRWSNWLPAERCRLPEYVPDVVGGKPSPLALTPWKIKAIKLMILLDKQGVVTRANMKALQISATRFCDPFNGFLAAAPSRGGYVRHASTPDLRRQHPVNYAEIEADYERWARPLFPGLFMDAA